MGYYDDDMNSRIWTFLHLTFARQFLLISFLILLSGVLIIGFWVGKQIEKGVVNRTAAMTALYVDSFVAQHLQELAHLDTMEIEQQDRLNALLTDTPLGKKIVAFKVWRQDGTVLYSTNSALIGQKFPITVPLEKAFNGSVHTEITDLSDPENKYERQSWVRLLETYAPVHDKDTNKIIAVIEFYQTTEELDREVNTAQWSSWVVVSLATLLMYLLLVGIVSRASNKLIAQEVELHDQVKQLTALLAQNDQLHNRVRRAAARTTALNEQYLRRIAADLHDGSAQDLALALLRIDAIAETCTTCAKTMGKEQTVSGDLHTIKTALQSALTDLRAVSSSLRLPVLETLSTVEVVKRSVGEYQRKTGKTVALEVGDLPEDVPLPVKITLYRLLQESLTNGYRHADGIGQKVTIHRNGNMLNIEVADAGPGFDANTIRDGHLGLAGMRERVEVLGGIFKVDSVMGVGSVIHAGLPLTILDVEDE